MTRHSNRFGFGPSDPRLLHFTDPEIINLFLHEAYGPRIDAGTEFFTVTPLDANKRVIQTNVVAEGGKASVSFSLNDLTRHFAGIWDRAAWFVLSHNHPSGSPAPSADDVHLTRVIHTWFRQKHPNTKLLDHIITTPTGRYRSVKEWEPRIWKE